MELTKYEINGYLLGKTIGQGTFGKVKLGTHKQTSQPVAIKILEKDKIKDVTDVERISRELHILKITQHSSIAQMYEIIETAKTIFIVMEYAPNGQFFDYVMDGKIKNEESAHFFFVQIVSGLEYLHKLKISHRDVKPENMLLDCHKRLKMVDFGLSNMYREKQQLITACGSPCYASPEMIKGEEYDPELTDVWSLGIVLFSMIFAKLPFEDDNTSILYSKIKAGLYVIDKRISPELKDLLAKMLCVEPKLRANIKVIKEHPWFRRDRGPKCYGILVGFEDIPIDENILEQMQELGYDVKQCRKYLQNNIRNQVTTAYYLLMKKNFIKGKPSRFDLCCEGFERKLIMPKKSSLKFRSYSTENRKNADFFKDNKQTIEFEEEIHPFNKLRNIKLANEGGNNKKINKLKNNFVKKQRNCISQMKSDEYKMKVSFYQTKNSVNAQGVYFNKPLNNRRKGITMNKRDSLSGSKKSDKSMSSKCKQKNIDDHNININVFINNAKIEKAYLQKKTPNNSYSKLQNSVLKLSNKGRRNIGRTDNNESRKRFRTEINEKTPKKKQSNRYKDQAMIESKSLQKSNEINLFDGMFWKKKSLNSRTKEKERYTDSRPIRNIPK